MNVCHNHTEATLASGEGAQRRSGPPRTLIAIPAYNEAATIAAVVGRVRATLPECDLLVVDDGSQDRTGTLLNELRVPTATHVCNLGYGRAIQTAIFYAHRHAYDWLVTLDADGQHQPEQVRSLLAKSETGTCDLIIGSRFVIARDYSGAPLGRQLGMRLFSAVVRAVTGQRIYDTTSGLKLIRRTLFEPLSKWHFIDFHAEAIVYILRLGYTVGELPISVRERTHGRSMYSWASHVSYPVKTMLVVVLGVVEAALTRKKVS